MIQGEADRAFDAAQAYPTDYEEFFLHNSIRTPASGSRPSSRRTGCDSSYAYRTFVFMLLLDRHRTCSGKSGDWNVPDFRFSQSWGNRLLLYSIMLCSTVLLITNNQKVRSESACSVYPDLFCTSSSRD